MASRPTVKRPSSQDALLADGVNDVADLLVVEQQVDELGHLEVVDGDLGLVEPGDDQVVLPYPPQRSTTLSACSWRQLCPGRPLMQRRLERACLGDAAAGGVEHSAEGAHRSGRLCCGGKQRSALLGGQIEALALGIITSVTRASENRSRPAANPLISRQGLGRGCYTNGFRHRTFRRPPLPRKEVEPPTRPRHHTPTANLCNGALSSTRAPGATRAA